MLYLTARDGQVDSHTGAAPAAPRVELLVSLAVRPSVITGQPGNSLATCQVGHVYSSLPAQGSDGIEARRRVHLWNLAAITGRRGFLKSG